MYQEHAHYKMVLSQDMSYYWAFEKTIWSNIYFSFKQEERTRAAKDTRSLENGIESNRGNENTHKK